MQPEKTIAKNGRWLLTLVAFFAAGFVLLCIPALANAEDPNLLGVEMHSVKPYETVYCPGVVPERGGFYAFTIKSRPHEVKLFPEDVIKEIIEMVKKDMMDKKKISKEEADSIVDKYCFDGKRIRRVPPDIMKFAKQKGGLLNRDGGYFDWHKTTDFEKIGIDKVILESGEEAYFVQASGKAREGDIVYDLILRAHISRDSDGGLFVRSIDWVANGGEQRIIGKVKKGNLEPEMEMSRIFGKIKEEIKIAQSQKGEKQKPVE